MLNPSAGGLQEDRNLVSDWPDMSDSEIEAAFDSPTQLVKEVPMSLQISNKKRRQLLKLQRARELEESNRRQRELRLLELQRAKEETANRLREEQRLIDEDPSVQKRVCVVIDIGRVREKVGEALEEGQVNKNVSVVVERWREGVRIPEAVKQTAEDQVMGESVQI